MNPAPPIPIEVSRAPPAAPAAPAFSYDTAFSRNLGWLTDWEQRSLRARRAAIAGLGGVGGVHLLTLARLGIGAFTLADPDSYDMVNLNRQVGATMASIGRPKCAVMAELARAINPELDLRLFPAGVTEETIDAFLADADVYVDGLDFFALDIRRKVFARCAQLGIPAVTAAPLGMGAAFLVFQPGGMTFEEYFRLEGLPEKRQYVRFLLGLSPKGLHLGYLADPAHVDLAGRRGPSTSMAAQLCAGVAGAEIVKLLTGRGPIHAAPFYHQFDAYRGRWVRGRLRFGANNPLHRVKLAIAERLFARMSRQAAPPAQPGPADEIGRILDAARWTPSGDNVQPWTITPGADALVLRVRLAAEGDLYDYRGGEPSLLAAGMFLESLRVAASEFGRAVLWEHQGREPDGRLRIRVRLPRTADIQPDPLRPHLFLRSVDRRPYRPGRLSAAQKAALEATVADRLRIDWQEDLRDRWGWARLGAKATDIRLRIPEAFRIHQRVIDWTQRFSTGGIPSGAVGLDRLTLRVMRWAFQDWSRMKRLNRLVGTFGAALQLDLLPGLFSSAFFVLRLSDAPLISPEDRERALLQAGGALQRFWLTADRLGLALQPAMATLIFADYGRRGVYFTADGAAPAHAEALGKAVDARLDGPAQGTVFLGRIGRKPRTAPRARSVRKPLAALVTPPATPVRSPSRPDDDAPSRTVGSPVEQPAVLEAAP